MEQSINIFSQSILAEYQHILAEKDYETFPRKREINSANQAGAALQYLLAISTANTDQCKTRCSQGCSTNTCVIH